MATKPIQGLSAETRAVIETVRAALAIPYAATAGHERTRAKILDERIMHVVVCLASLLHRDDAAELPGTLDYLRERLAEHPPAGYVTAEQAKARVAEGASWADAVRLDYVQDTGGDAGQRDDAGDGDAGGGEPTWCAFAGVPHTQHHATVFYDERTASGGPHTRGTPDVIRTVDIVSDGGEARIEVAVYRGAVNEGRPDVVAFTPAGAARAARWWPPRFAQGLAAAVRLLAADAAVTAGAA